MSTLTQSLNIKTQTSGFASPAETYVNTRLDINELIVKDVYTTFYFRYSGPKVFNIQQGDIIVVDRSEIPNENDLVVLIEKNYFAIREYCGQNNLWGKITWTLNKK